MDEKKQERRENNRVSAYWEFYLDNNLSGYITNISPNGIKLLVDKDAKIKDNRFSIDVIPPTEVDMEKMNLNLKVVWRNPQKSPLIDELGCQFDNFNSENKENINKMINFFI